MEHSMTKITKAVFILSTLCIFTDKQTLSMKRSYADIRPQVPFDNNNNNSKSNPPQTNPITPTPQNQTKSSEATIFKNNIWGGHAKI